MSKQSKPQLTQQQLDHKANMANKNLGTSGVNTTYAKNQGNRGKQLNPKQR